MEFLDFEEATLGRTQCTVRAVCCQGGRAVMSCWVVTVPVMLKIVLCVIQCILHTVFFFPSETCLKEMLWGLGEPVPSCSVQPSLHWYLNWLWCILWPRSEPLVHGGVSWAALVHTLCSGDFILCLSVPRAVDLQVGFPKPSEHETVPSKCLQNGHNVLKQSQQVPLHLLHLCSAAVSAPPGLRYFLSLPAEPSKRCKLA